MAFIDSLSWCCSASAIFLCAAALDLRHLQNVEIKTKLSAHRFLKIIFSISFAIVHYQDYKVWSRIRPLSNLSAGLDHVAIALASVVVCLLSFVAHARSVRPSTTLTVYLCTILAYDGFRILQYESNEFLLLHLCLGLALCITECWSKRTSLISTYSTLSPYALAGTVDRLFLLWVNGVLRKSHHLSALNLPAIDDNLSPGPIRTKVILAWSRSNTLLPVLLRCNLSELIAPVPSRLLLIALKYSQPTLIAATIDFVDNRASIEQRNDSTTLIIKAVVVYIGIALATSRYQHRLNKLKLILQANLVTLLHEKTLSINNEIGRADDGSASTLITTDVEALLPLGGMFHDGWAHLLEVIIGMWLLITRVNWAAPVLVASIYACSRVSKFVATSLPQQQKAWRAATQKRVAATEACLNSIKSIKMAGYMGPTKVALNEFRDEELATSVAARWTMIAYNASDEEFSWRSNPLDTKTAFTTLTVLSMLTHPTNMLMTIFPKLVGAYTSVQRIEKYLKEPDVPFTRNERQNIDQKEPTVSMEKATFCLHPGGPPILKGIDLSLSPGLTVCLGPVGSGKTNLAKALLGDLSLTHGSCSLSNEAIGLCTQTAWLPGGSFKEAVAGTGNKDIDLDWYEKVISACCLEVDIHATTEGHDTPIGSGGINLSGGQKQRVALARALYARPSFLILDNSFSALDSGTESCIVQNLFGPQGLLRIGQQATVFLITANAAHCQLSNHVVMMENLIIKSQGTKTSITSKNTTTTNPLVTTQVKVPFTTESTIERTAINDSYKIEAAKHNLTWAQKDFAIYGYYFRSIGARNLLRLVSCTASYAFFLSAPHYWLKLWTQSQHTGSGFPVGYFLLSFVAWVSTNGTMWTTLMRVGPISGQKLHSDLLETVANAHISTFFATSPGTILNRFGQDIQLIDGDLPSSVMAISNQVFKLAMHGLLLVSANANTRLAMTLPACLVVVYVVQRYYLRTSKLLRVLELESRADVLTSMLETSRGRTTIRAFKWNDQYVEKNNDALDTLQRVLFLSMCVQQWLKIIFDLLVATIAIATVFFAVRSDATVDGAKIGIALNIVLVTNSTLLSLIESWTTFEISLGAVARLKAFNDNTVREVNPDFPGEPDQHWPSRGELMIDGLQVSYGLEKIALHPLSVCVKPGQRALLYGRTGSGKSTLMMALLKLLELDQGSISVDGQDLSQVSQSLVRERCFITIPQEPALFPQLSLALNVDPTGLYEKTQIISAMEATSLWEVFCNALAGSNEKISSGAMLDRPLSRFPQLTPGQLQLFSVSRAILRSEVPERALMKVPLKPIVLLDEATSSVDENTERLIYNVLEKHLGAKGLTFIIISHRVNTAMEFLRTGEDILIELGHGRVQSIRTAP